MKDNIKKHCDDLQQAVQHAYDAGVTMEEAERLAAKTLGVQLDLAAALASADLDARMRKNGVKAVKAQAYMEEIGAHDKKPSEGFLEQSVNLNPLVNKEIDAYEKAENAREELQSYFGIFKDAHIYFRGISKGRYE